MNSPPTPPLQAQDHKGNLYEVTEDHTQAREVGTEEWKDLATIRVEVGPLYLLPREDVPRG